MRIMRKPKISFETDRLFIRSIIEEDKETYMGMRLPADDISNSYSMPYGFRDILWEKELNSGDAAYVIVLRKEDDEPVAIGSFQKLNTATVELGFVVAERHRMQGIATELLKGMIREVQHDFPEKAVRICTRITNTACRRVAEKCGGVLSGNEFGPATEALASLLVSAERRLSEDDGELKRLRNSITSFIEENKEGVCIYRFM